MRDSSSAFSRRLMENLRAAPHDERPAVIRAAIQYAVRHKEIPKAAAIDILTAAARAFRVSGASIRTKTAPSPSPPAPRGNIFSDLVVHLAGGSDAHAVDVDDERVA